MASGPEAYNARLVKECGKRGLLYHPAMGCVTREQAGLTSPGGTTMALSRLPSGGLSVMSSRFTSSRSGVFPGTMSLTPGTTPGPGPFAQPGGMATDPYGMLTTTGCNFITNPTARLACQAAAALLRPGGGGGNGGGAGGGNLVPQPCPTGHVLAQDGTCMRTGLSRILPGDIGLSDEAWIPVAGRYGAGYTPAQVERVRLECPAGYVLGKDEICYDRLRKGDRKHNPGTKPFLSGGEVAAIRRANRLRKKFGRLTMGKNPLFAARAKRCAPKRGKK